MGLMDVMNVSDAIDALAEAEHQAELNRRERLKAEGSHG